MTERKRRHDWRGGNRRAHISELEKSLEEARRERDEAIRIGKQFHADARRHFDQSCINLQRAETAERERDVAQAMLAEREGLLAGAQERLDNAYKGLQQAVAERDAAEADNAALVRAARLVLMDCAEPNGTFKTLIRAVQEMGIVVNQHHPGAALLERMGRLEEASTKAAAELRHAYGHLAHGQHINPDLVARAIRILETATAKALEET